MTACFGIIGHGAVGSLFTRLTRERGARVLCYDILLEGDATAEAMRRKILAAGGEPATFDEALRESDCVLAVTPAQECHRALARARGGLRRGQVYCDLASTSPAVKREMAAQVEGTGALFVEGVILGAVGASPVSPAILLGGPGAEAVAPVFQQYGLRARFYAREIGRASAFKLLRSVFSKGMETLLIETLVAARRAGMLDEVWQEVVSTLAKDGVERMLETWIRSHAVSSERRYYEMQEVNRFLDELGADPVVTRGTVQVFRRSNEMGMPSRFAGVEPERFADVIEFIAGELRERGKTASRG